VVEILHPPVGFDGTMPPPAVKNDDNSLVLRISYGAVSFLLPGDIYTGAEKRIVERYGDELSSTVLLAPHHGSRRSNSALFIGAVNPQVAIISAGWNNFYGFPHETVLARYREGGIRVYQTAVNGAVNIKTDGRRVRVIPFVGKKRVFKNAVVIR
jgi:competence protein ComEC